MCQKCTDSGLDMPTGFVKVKLSSFSFNETLCEPNCVKCKKTLPNGEGYQDFSVEWDRILCEDCTHSELK